MDSSLVPEAKHDCSQDVYVNKDGVIRSGCVLPSTPIDYKPCELAIDFQRDVGTMDYMLPAIDSQMTSDKFSCTESSFKFSGFKWSTGAGAADYVKEAFQ